MKKLLVLFFLFLVSITETFAYAIKVYDEYGNRIGTYRKEGDNYQLYDFYDNKITNPEMLIKNVPNQRTLTEYSQTFYDENMMPIGTWKSGLYDSNGRYYPREWEFVPTCWRRTNTPHIVRPNNNSNLARYSRYENNHINYIDTRYPRFHKFR